MNIISMAQATHRKARMIKTSQKSEMKRTQPKSRRFVSKAAQLTDNLPLNNKMTVIVLDISAVPLPENQEMHVHLVNRIATKSY
jgi:hypothetical protein